MFATQSDVICMSSETGRTKSLDALRKLLPHEPIIKQLLAEATDDQCYLFPRICRPNALSHQRTIRQMNPLRSSPIERSSNKHDLFFQTYLKSQRQKRWTGCRRQKISSLLKYSPSLACNFKQYAILKNGNPLPLNVIVFFPGSKNKMETILTDIIRRGSNPGNKWVSIPSPRA
jgi:hypothetical protein